MADTIFILGLASFLHYFDIFTFHSAHYLSLFFFLFSIGFFISAWKRMFETGEDKDK